MTRDPTVYVGTYTDEASDGIYTCSADPDTGAVEGVELAATTADPSFLAVHPNGESLYAVNEVDDGGVTAFAIEDDGSLTELDRVSSGAAGPCHVSAEATGQYLLVSNYAGGAVAMVPVEADGSVGEPTHVIDREGSSVVEDRQETAHVHSATPGPDNEVAYVADLGTDELVVYDMDLENGRLEDPTAVDVEPGAGPRHVDLSPDGSRLHLLCELDNTLRTFERDDDGYLSEVDSVETLPADWEGESYTAEVRVHPSGEFVYASNRGHDSIATFELDDGGLPSIAGHTSTGGEWPRNFTITPDGRHLLVANQFTDDVVTFEIDGQNGTLDPTGRTASVSQPVCLRVSE